MASLFVEEARQSTHVYTDFERFPLVWSYPMYRGAQFEQIYIIPSPTKDEAQDFQKTQNQHPLRGSKATVLPDLSFLSEKLLACTHASIVALFESVLESINMQFKAERFYEVLNT